MTMWNFFATACHSSSCSRRVIKDIGRAGPEGMWAHSWGPMRSWELATPRPRPG